MPGSRYEGLNLQGPFPVLLCACCRPSMGAGFTWGARDDGNRKSVPAAHRCAPSKGSAFGGGGSKGCMLALDTEMAKERHHPTPTRPERTQTMSRGLPIDPELKTFHVR